MNTETEIERLKTEKALLLKGVVAMAPGRVIGKDGGMPWHLPDDLKTFRRLTTGHSVLMGRKTYESIGRPLPNRQNIVLTRDQSWTKEGVRVIHDLEELNTLGLMGDELCIIGGSEIFALFLKSLDVLWVSHIKDTYPGDTFFPEFETLFKRKELMESFPAFDLWKYSIRQKASRSYFIIPLFLPET